MRRAEHSKMRETPGTAAIKSKALLREVLFFPDGKAGTFGQQKLELWAPRSHPQYSIVSTSGGSGPEGPATPTPPRHKGPLVLCAKLGSKRACLPAGGSRHECFQSARACRACGVVKLTSNVMVASAVSDCPAPGAREQTCLPDGCLPKESIKRVAYASSTSARRESKNETLHGTSASPR